MLYMVMHKADDASEAGEKPTPELMMRVGEMVGTLARSGVLVAGEGLGPSAEGARVRVAGGRATVERGPFRGDALPSRYAIFRAADVDEAADLAGRFGRTFGDVVVDVRHVNEPWDLGFGEKPAGLATRRYMAVVNADAASEAGAVLRPEQEAALATFAAELRGADALIEIGALEPSAKSRRLHPRAGAAGDEGRQAKPLVLDGPFAETKELIGGFVLVDVPTIDDAVAIALDYADAVPVEEMDVRGVASRQVFAAASLDA